MKGSCVDGCVVVAAATTAADDMSAAVVACNFVDTIG